MDRLKNYMRSAMYSIGHNKAYAVFCVVGTAFTFVFIIIMLQLVYDLTASKRPFVNGDRTVVFSSFKNTKGKDIGGLYGGTTDWFMEKVRGKEEFYMYYYSMGEVSVGDACKTLSFAFVNGGYWKVNEFDFVEGRAFTEEECRKKDALAVLREDVARIFFKGGRAVGQKIEVQGRDYTVVGVVGKYSNFGIQGDGIWVPYVFNTFSPRGFNYYDYGLMFPREVPVETAKKQVAAAIREYWATMHAEVNVTAENLYTFQETRVNALGQDLYAYGLPVALLLLLMIPAINIVTLNMANVDNYTGEIALKRALGAGVFDSFVQVMTEIFILVVVGTVVGLCLTIPVADALSALLISTGDDGRVLLIENLNFQVLLCGVFPLALVFSLLSGGIPAYMVAKSNIAMMLKGGSK